MSPPDRDDFDYAISLGADCQVAHQLEVARLRVKAYPFDRVVTPLNSLVQLFRADFKGFAVRDHLRLEDGPPPFVLETHYGVQFYHDFFDEKAPAKSFLASYEEDYPKLQRRIKRLAETLDSGGRILFVRREREGEDSSCLDELIHSRWPDLRYHLAVVGKDPVRLADRERVSFHRIVDPVPWTWQGDDEAWGKFLASFTILSPRVVWEKRKGRG